jgi:RNA polymerase sigma-70 factor (ECF subfamily)
MGGVGGQAGGWLRPIRAERSARHVVVLDVARGSRSGPLTPVGLGEQFDEALAAARRGEEWALVALYRELHPGLLRYLVARVGGEGEDLASEVWLDVARSLERFSGNEAGFRAWVFTMARREVIDHRRKRARRRTSLTDRVVEMPAPGQTEDEALAALAGDEAVRRIVALLPAEQAEVVLLRVVAGLGVAEVAAIVGRSPAAVSVLAHRALRRLARHLGDSK